MGTPNLASGGGVFRNYRGFVKSCFVHPIPLAFAFAFEAKIVVAIYTVDLAWKRSWREFWSEENSVCGKYLL